MWQLFLFLAIATAFPAATDDDPRGPAREGRDYARFEVSKLCCVIGNNKSMPGHKGGCNGLFSMTPAHEKDTVYVPRFAGLNLEHYFDGNVLDDMTVQERFDPRCSQMEFRRLGSTRAELYQPPTVRFGVESRTLFELKEPYYVDVTYRCIPNKEVLDHFLGVFWASYINAPSDKSIYFLGREGGVDPERSPTWMQFCTQKHGHFSTVMHVSGVGPTSFRKGRAALWNQMSPLRFDAPFFYGRIGQTVLIYIFEPNPGLRFAHSPNSGGVRTPDGSDTCPAWDFQLMICDPKPGVEYGLRMRVVCKPWVDRQDVLEEVRIYRQSIARVLPETKPAKARP